MTMKKGSHLYIRSWKSRWNCTESHRLRVDNGDFITSYNTPLPQGRSLLHRLFRANKALQKLSVVNILRTNIETPEKLHSGLRLAPVDQDIHSSWVVQWFGLQLRMYMVMKHWFHGLWGAIRDPNGYKCPDCTWQPGVLFLQAACRPNFEFLESSFRRKTIVECSSRDIFECFRLMKKKCI